MVFYIITLAILAFAWEACRQRGQRAWMNAILVVTIILVVIRLILALTG